MGSGFRRGCGVRTSDHKRQQPRRRGHRSCVFDRSDWSELVKIVLSAGSVTSTFPCAVPAVLTTRVSTPDALGRSQCIHRSGGLGHSTLADVGRAPSPGRAVSGLVPSSSDLPRVPNLNVTPAASGAQGGAPVNCGVAVTAGNTAGDRRLTRRRFSPSTRIYCPSHA